MFMTDGKRTVSIKMMIWQDASTSYTPDFADEFFDDAAFGPDDPITGEPMRYVDDVEYCIDVAREWESEDENNTVFVEDAPTHKTVYELRRNSTEIKGDVTKAIYHGCVCDELMRSCADCGGELVKRFADKAEALAALAGYTTSIHAFSSRFFLVEEFYVEENIYEIDEDGDEEWISGGDIWEYSAMPEEFCCGCYTYRWNETYNRYDEIEEEEEEEE